MFFLIGNKPSTYNAEFIPNPPDPPSPTGDKPNVLIGAAGLGLASAFQDQFHIADPVNMAYNLWGAHAGSSNRPIAPPSTVFSNSCRMATVEVGGKPPRRVHEFRMPPQVWWGWTNSLDILPGTNKGAVAVDLFIPSSHRYESANNKRNGKTSIGLWTGPNTATSHVGADGGNTYPWQQAHAGGANAHHGFNFGFDTVDGPIKLLLYSHALGYSGTASKRTKLPNPDGSAGILHPVLGWTTFTVQRERWVTIEMFVQVDTNGQNGILSAWLTDQGVTTRVIHLTDLDFGGMTGTRNYATMPRQDNFTWGATPQSLVITQPSKVLGIMSRHMPGGWPGGDTTTDRNNWWNKVGYDGRFYYHNWRYFRGN